MGCSLKKGGQALGEKKPLKGVEKIGHKNKMGASSQTVL
jgi:hypothetical protein